MKKALSIILALGLVFSFTACGNSNTTQKQTADDKIVVEDTVYDISGDVEKSEGGQLTIASNAKEELTFNIENAEIVPDDTIESGDRVNITYTGEIKGGDAKDCKVIKVEDTTEKVKTIKGKVLEHTEDGVIIKTSDGKELKFDIEGAELRYKDGIKKGDSIAVSYTGRINGTDTSGATVHEVTDNMKTKHKEAVKVTIKTVNETVYTCTIVNVRSTHSLAGTKIGTLDPKTKLTRTGICSNGWSRVNYNGKIAYVSSSYLTTKKPAIKKETKKETAKKETKAKEDPTKAPPKNTTTTMTCKIKDATMNSIQVTCNGKTYEFDMGNADINTVNGLVIGNTIQIEYKGKINGTDTSKVKVLSIVDKAKNKTSTNTEESMVSDPSESESVASDTQD